MALESLFELSRACKACNNCDLLVSTETACYMQDLPQTSRCRHDMDAGLDFAQAEGYLAMLQVLKCCPPDSVDAEIAASILAGFAAGLSVLPWQPDRDSRDTNFIVDMLQDDDFRYCTKHLLYALLDVLEPYATGSSDAISGEKLRVQEAAASAMCSFAHAASDVHALVHCPVGKALRARHLPDDHPAMRGYVRRLSYSFTTICPVAWPLDTPWPRGLVHVDEIWVPSVRDVLSNQRTLSILLNCAKRETSRIIAADCIRTLSWLWTRRMMYWHRHDLRMHPDKTAPNLRGTSGTNLNAQCLPPALVDMGGNRKGMNLRELRNLVKRCLARPESFSAFLQLHLAKIFISQKLREADTDVERLLLECLKYWRRAHGTRELDWFAIETIESIRDLLHVAAHRSKQELKLMMCKSPGGVDCLRIMIIGWVSRIRADRFYTNMEDFDQSLLHLLSKTRMNCWSMEGTKANYHAIPCSGAAAGLLADLLEVGPSLLEGGDMETQITIASDPERHGYGFPRTPPPADTAESSMDSRRTCDDPRTTAVRGASPSLHYNLLIKWDQAHSGRAASQAFASRPNAGCCGRIRIFLRTSIACLVLVFWESLGHPAWLPAISLFEDIEAAYRTDERIQVLAEGLDALLATKHAIRVIKIVLEAYPRRAFDARLVTAFIPVMVDLLTGPCAGLHERLYLDKLDADCNIEIRRGIIDVLKEVVPRIDELGSRAPDGDELEIDPSLPSIFPLECSKRRLILHSRVYCSLRPSSPDSTGEMARHMQDLPLLSRCSNDVDAGRDFARAEGYVVMLQVLECAPPNAGEVEMAASILAGFGWGLSVLPWQHDREVEDKDFVLKMLLDDDFHYCTKELLHELLKLLPCLPPQTGGSRSACTRPDNGSLQEAAISALCSFSHAASDVHSQAERCERCEQGASAGNLECDASDCTIRLCNAFSTKCPTSWLLKKEMPDFRGAGNTWVRAVTSVLDNQAAVDLLLSCARNELNVSRRFVGDAIRTLSSLWSCKAIYWHRFDKRIPKDFPPPLADVSTLPNHEEVTQKLASLVHESAADRSSVSPLAKLHLAQILISQNIRDEQLDVDIADVLLHCLRYWRRAVGNHLLEYFACEVMETLWDLFETSENKVSILGRIERSPGGVGCLKLMTSTVLAPIRAVRLEHNNFDSLLSDYLLKDKVNDWCTEDYVTDCAGTAAGLLALFLSVPGGPDFITPANIEFLGAAVEHATCDGQAPISQPLVENVLGRLGRALGWLCILLGHLTWQPRTSQCVAETISNSRA
ncbi:hypothetical protein CBR_g55413 [Chara braunii]|uniref:Uncharacterized protein n=1 Tax=Chara braunii TaxID=69332 RepID=A0A388K7N8_CHABU|nr:hypothetical protein CBR_g55413 [Chara braunii]|eukprot:GBG66070.1 hypothetical protein CBR_g55413 [Chara braunii]